MNLKRLFIFGGILGVLGGFVGVVVVGAMLILDEDDRNFEADLQDTMAPYSLGA